MRVRLYAIYSNLGKRKTKEDSEDTGHSGPLVNRFLIAPVSLLICFRECIARLLPDCVIAMAMVCRLSAAPPNYCAMHDLINLDRLPRLSFGNSDNCFCISQISELVKLRLIDRKRFVCWALAGLWPLQPAPSSRLLCLVRVEWRHARPSSDFWRRKIRSAEFLNIFIAMMSFRRSGCWKALRAADAFANRWRWLMDHVTGSKSSAE